MIDPNLLIKIVWTIISAMGFAFAAKSVFNKYQYRKILLKPDSSELRRLELTRPIVTMSFFAAILFAFVLLGAFALAIPSTRPGVVNPTIIVYYSITILIDLIPVSAVIYDLWADTWRTEIVQREHPQ